MDLDKALKEIHSVQSQEALEEVRVKYLGRKGIIAELFSELPKLKGEERAKRGQELNSLKLDITLTLKQKAKELEGVALDKLTQAERLDVTLPGTRPPLGHLHIITQAIEEITRIFAQIGFRRVRYPEVDFDWYPFGGLNMPKDHPARDEWETFFVNAPVHPKFGRMVLTPHSTSGDVHELEKGKLPIRTINITKCYRRQSDVSHVPMFHQFDGLYVDNNASITHLKGVLDYFVRSFFGSERKARIRPFHFRFTEPSFEVDVSCGACGGSGFIDPSPSPSHQGRGIDRSSSPLVRKDTGGGRCRLCKSGWLELGGSGMLHPNVLKLSGIDPNKWKGFAFGWGVERTYMMKSGLRIDDIRVLYNNDLNFLEQF